MEQKEFATIVTVEKSVYEYDKQGKLNVIEVHESIDFEVYVGSPNWMLRPYVHLIEMMILDNYDYFDIAKECKVTTLLYNKLDEYEPASEQYLVEILASILYDNCIYVVTPSMGNVMYSIRHQDMGSGI